MSAQVAQDLRAAAEVLERDGWTQDESISDSGQHCAIGAIVEAVDKDMSRENPAYYTFRDYLGQSVSRWNDRKGRTADEVIDALRAAADAAEAQQ